MIKEQEAPELLATRKKEKCCRTNTQDCLILSIIGFFLFNPRSNIGPDLPHDRALDEEVIHSLQIPMAELTEIFIRPTTLLQAGSRPDSVLQKQPKEIFALGRCGTSPYF